VLDGQLVVAERPAGVPGEDLQVHLVLAGLTGVGSPVSREAADGMSGH
jgi:hypothetical protein